MKTVLVLHQLLVIIEREARPIARKFGLTPEDVLILGWLVDHDATRGSLIADRLGRSRQSVQRSLERLERAALVERYGHSITGKTAAWALTIAGNERWRELQFHFDLQDRLLSQLEPKRVIDLVERLARELVLANQSISIAGLKEIPTRPGPPVRDL